MPVALPPQPLLRLRCALRHASSSSGEARTTSLRSTREQWMEPRETRRPRTRPKVNLAPVRSPSSATLVADSLRRLIALGGLSPGERLPSERQLAETLHVGRDSIRAAMRTLNDEALVETRLGRRGGTF